MPDYNAGLQPWPLGSTSSAINFARGTGYPGGDDPFDSPGPLRATFQRQPQCDDIPTLVMAVRVVSVWVTAKRDRSSLSPRAIQSYSDSLRAFAGENLTVLLALISMACPFL